MEHRRVGGVGLVGAVHATRADDADGRLAGGHDAGLHRGGVGAQHDVVIHVEGVLGVARRMVLRDVQQLEVVVVVLHLGALHDLVAHAHEDVDHLLKGDVHRVQGACAARRSRQGHVHSLGLQAGLLLAFLQLCAALLQRILQGLAHVVHQLAHLRALLGGELAHAAQQTGQLALLAEDVDANLLQATGRLRFAELVQHALTDLTKFVLHVLSLSFMRIVARGKEKSLAPSLQGRSIASLYHPDSSCGRAAKPLIRITRMNPFAPTAASARKLRSELHRRKSVQRSQPKAPFSDRIPPAGYSLHHCCSFGL